MKIPATTSPNKRFFGNVYGKRFSILQIYGTILILCKCTQMQKLGV